MTESVLEYLVRVMGFRTAPKILGRIEEVEDMSQKEEQEGRESGGFLRLRIHLKYTASLILIYIPLLLSVFVVICVVLSSFVIHAIKSSFLLNPFFFFCSNSGPGA